MKRNLIWFFLFINVHTYCQDIINPYLDYVNQQYGVLANSPYYLFNNIDRVVPFIGEYEIILDELAWGNSDYLRIIHTPAQGPFPAHDDPVFDLNNFSLWYCIELVSFPFSLDCAFARASDTDGGCAGSIGRSFNVADDNLYSNEGWTYPYLNPLYTNRLWNKSDIRKLDRDPNLKSAFSSSNDLVSINFTADVGISITNTVFPHSILKHTIYLICGTTFSVGDQISSISFYLDHTRGRLREYPFCSNSINITPRDYDLVLRPSFLPYNNYNSTENCKFTRPFSGYDCDLNKEGSNINYFPFDPASDDNCSFIDLNHNADYSSDFSYSNALAGTLRIEKLPLPDYTLIAGTSVRDSRGTTLAGYNEYNSTSSIMFLLYSTPIVHEYNIDKNIDLTIINEEDKIIFNPSEVNISANNLIFPANYTFKTIRGEFATKSDVASADIPANGGPFNDPTNRNVPVETDLFKDFHITDSKYSATDHRLASLYHLQSGSKLTIEPCVKIFDATFEINEGSEIVFENWPTNQINVDRYQLLYEGGKVTKRQENFYFQGTAEAESILKYEASNEIVSGENVDPNNSSSGGYAVVPDADVRFKAAEHITLKPGFHAKQGGNFLASIGPVSIPDCPPQRKRSLNANNFATTANEVIGYFTCSPNPATINEYFMFETKSSSKVKISIYNSIGVLVKLIGEESFLPAGKYTYTLPVNNLAQGLYIAKLQTNDGAKSVKFIKQ